MDSGFGGVGGAERDVEHGLREKKSERRKVGRQQNQEGERLTGCVLHQDGGLDYLRLN